MGLFDWINCDYPLPGNPEIKLASYSPEGMQTKDLTNGQDVYRITADGRLLFEKYGNWREDKTGQYIDFTGEIEFEDSEQWFHATFEAGVVQKIITHGEWLEGREPCGITVDDIDGFVQATAPTFGRMKFP
jgi:hypothetical protein